MNQHSVSLWHATRPSPAFAPLRETLEADVAIVGAGITGLTAAVLLAQRGRRVVVLERETVGSGETGNTTAHLTVAIDARYRELLRRYGAEETRRIAAASQAALEKLAELTAAHAIECGFRRVPGYLYSERADDVESLREEVAAAREAGLDAEWTDRVPLPFSTGGAARFPAQAQFHPLAYLRGLVAVATGLGVRIFERTQVTSIEKDPVRVVAEAGTVTAGAAFMATNVPVSGFTSVHTRTAPYRTYAIAFEAAPGDFDGLFWDTDDPYHYTRLHETSEGTFLIVGGEDHRVGELEDGADPFARLEAWARERFGARTARFRWSGQVIEPHGGIPLIGGADGVYVATGYSGQGMTFGTLGAMIVSDRITGVANPWADVFDVGRIAAHAATREFVSENAHFPRHLASDRIANRDVEGAGLSDLRAGEARIVAAGGRKVAAWRDDSGALHTVSPVCPHMKCDVAWNPAERTWDCPCHGSRFAPDGEVLNGPATESLERLEEESVQEGWRRERDSNPR